MFSHSSVPIADQIDGDIYRIYFSGRYKRNVSRIGFIEIDIRNPKKVLFLSPEPILKEGHLGEFDDSGVVSSCIVNFQGKKYLYYIGWNLRVTVPFSNAVGLAVSNDQGKTFERYSRAPILDRGIHDSCFVASPFVLFEENIWKLWYSSCIRWEQQEDKPKHYYHIKYAESKNGIDWERKGVICIDFKTKEEFAIARPCVLKEGGIYKMWYSYRGKSYRIGYAESRDGKSWVRKDEEVGIDVSDSGGDSESIEYSFVFNHKGTRYMLYNGNQYGRMGIELAILDKES